MLFGATWVLAQPQLGLLLWLHGLILPCSCEEKGLVVKVKGTNSSDVICGKYPMPRADPVQSREPPQGSSSCSTQKSWPHEWCFWERKV